MSRSLNPPAGSAVGAPVSKDVTSSPRAPPPLSFLHLVSNLRPYLHPLNFILISQLLVWRLHLIPCPGPRSPRPCHSRPILSRTLHNFQCFSFKFWTKRSFLKTSQSGLLWRFKSWHRKRLRTGDTPQASTNWECDAFSFWHQHCRRFRLIFWLCLETKRFRFFEPYWEIIHKTIVTLLHKMGYWELTIFGFTRNCF